MNDLAMKMDRIVNGVNVDDVQTLVGAIQEDANLAASHFRLTNKWVSGGHNQSRISGFYSGGQDHEHQQEFCVDADEPPVLAGHDIAANPVEYLLSALTACLTTTLIYHAAVRGIEIRSLEADVEGDLDLRGFLGLTDEARSGFQNVRVRYRIDADPENIEMLAELMKLSPVYDVTRNGTNVDVSMARM